MIVRLKSVNYYRLSSYWYPFQEKKGNNFRSGTRWSLIWNYYLADRRLRLLLLDAIERIEIALRTLVAYHWYSFESQTLGQNCFNPQKAYFAKYPSFKKEIQNLYKKSSHKIHMRKTQYNSCKNVDDLPIWICIELMSFGQVRTIYEFLDVKVKTIIAEEFGFFSVELFSRVLVRLRQVRNACAHQDRVWNKTWRSFDAPSIQDSIAVNDECFYVWDRNVKSWKCGNTLSAGVDKDTTAFVLMLCNRLLGVAAITSQWKCRVIELLDFYSSFSKGKEGIGFKPYVETHPMWLR